MTEYWNRCHECEQQLTEPEDTPGLCAPCRLAGKLAAYHRRGRDVDFSETDGHRALYTNPDANKSNF